MQHYKLLLAVVLTLFFVPLLIIGYVMAVGIRADKSDKFIAEAVAKNDIKICEKVFGNSFSMGAPSTSQLKQRCHEQVAVSSKNPKACYSSDDYCLDKVAKAANDIAICDLVKSENAKGVCYGFFAVQKKNISPCKGLAEANIRERCYLSFVDFNKIDASFCENNFQTLEWKQSCFFSAARDARDEALCQKVDPYQTKNCILGVRANYARF